MTPDEFEFWQRAYLAALAGLSTVPEFSASVCDSMAVEAANLAIDRYHIAKATVVQTTYATAD